MITPRIISVIMAGGQGQRFWPLSTVTKPKQFLDLRGTGRTLLQATYDRVLPLTGNPEQVFVATSIRYADLVHDQLPALPNDNLLIEPVGRDSAPAIALVNLAISQRFGPTTIAGFFSSDHEVQDPSEFIRSVSAAISLADEHDALVTIGIPPTRPATGYGYIELGDRIGLGHRVARFVEKPNERTANVYMKSGNFLWNAGIFVWRVEAALSELDLHAPVLMHPLRQALETDTVKDVFPTLKKISIDFALMEHTTRAMVVPGDFGWDDVGDWVALERLLGANGAGHNTVVGRNIAKDASHNIIYTDSPDDVIITLGVHDLIVVKRGHTVMLVHKQRVQEIKELLADERMAVILEEADDAT